MCVHAQISAQYTAHIQHMIHVSTPHIHNGGSPVKAVSTAAAVGATHQRRWGQGYVADGGLELVYRGHRHGAVGRQGLDLDLELLAVVLVFLGLIGGEEMGLDFGGRWKGKR